MWGGAGPTHTSVWSSLGQSYSSLTAPPVLCGCKHGRQQRPLQGVCKWSVRPKCTPLLYSRRVLECAQAQPDLATPFTQHTGNTGLRTCSCCPICSSVCMTLRVLTTSAALGNSLGSGPASSRTAASNTSAGEATRQACSSSGSRSGGAAGPCQQALKHSSLP